VAVILSEWMNIIMSVLSRMLPAHTLDQGQESPHADIYMEINASPTSYSDE